MEEGDSEFIDHDVSDREFSEYGQADDEFSDYDESDNGFGETKEPADEFPGYLESDGWIAEGDGFYRIEELKSMQDRVEAALRAPYARRATRKRLAEEATKIGKPLPLKSLIDIVISKFAKEAIMLYDQKDNNFELLNQYINDKFSEIGSSEICRGFLDNIYKIIVREFKRADIFGKEFVRLYVTNEDKSLSLNFFNNFNEDVKYAIVEWLIIDLINYRNFDTLELAECEGYYLNGKEVHFYIKDKKQAYDILTFIFTQPLNFSFCDKAIKALYIIKYNPTITTAIEEDNENTASYRWDEQGNLTILTTNDHEGARLLAKLSKVYHYLVKLARSLETFIKISLKKRIKTKKFKQEELYNEELSVETAKLEKIMLEYFDDNSQEDDDSDEDDSTQRLAPIGKKIQHFADNFDKTELEKILDYLFLTKPKFLARFMDVEINDGLLPLDFMTYMYPEQKDMDAAVERIFEMLCQYFKEYAQVIYKKDLRYILKSRMLIMSHLAEDLCDSVSDKLVSLILIGEYDGVMKELYSYYERFGLEFIKEIVALIPTYIPDVELDMQRLILFDFAKILLKFARRYGIKEEELAFEFENLAYLDSLYLKSKCIEFFYEDITEIGIP